MNKIVYIDSDKYGRLFVREIIPDEARPVEEWYNTEFASHCMEVDKTVTPNMLYNEDRNIFYGWCPIEDDTYFHKADLKTAIETVLNSI